LNRRVYINLFYVIELPKIDCNAGWKTRCW